MAVLRMQAFKLIYLAILVMGVVSCSTTPRGEMTPVEENRIVSQQALKIIESWRDSASVAGGPRVVHIAYWTPSDRDPVPEYRERLTRVMKFIQDFYAVRMQRVGFGDNTISLDIAEDGLLNIHLTKSVNPYVDYCKYDGDKIRSECSNAFDAAGIDLSKETVLLFCNMANWDPVKSIISQNSPFCASGCNQNGFGWQVDSPLLDTKLLKRTEPMLTDSRFGYISLGSYNSHFIGGVCHELGHALGLPHNGDRLDEEEAFGTALMGYGNKTYAQELRGEGKGTFLSLASALRLVTHPMFSGTAQDLKKTGKAKLVGVDVKIVDKELVVTGKVTNETNALPVYAVIGYFDPADGSNYDATTAVSVPSVDGSFTLHSRCLETNKAATLYLNVLYVNGTASWYLHPDMFATTYSVNSDGDPSLETFEMSKRIAPLSKALTSNDKIAVELALNHIIEYGNEKGIAIARRLVADSPIYPKPAEVGSSVTNVILSDATVSSEKVGWAEPVYNRLPANNSMLVAVDKVFTSGIYAHAPARHTYNLGGKWKRFTGTVALASHQHGTVTFYIKGDGKELWHSKWMVIGRLDQFDIDLSGVKELELIVDDGDNGTHGDMGLWLEPLIVR